ncbi:MAG: CAP domain-containing protein [Acidimicrobiales bacterium]|nr:CAP domain-containing protein [Acidimicrobiales bacterium]
MNSMRSAPLQSDGAVASIALSWSRSMAERQSLSHNGGHASQIRSVRPQASATAENVGYSSQGASHVFSQFAGSPGHRANMANPAYTHAGVGCAVDGQGKTWVTINFWG